MSTYTEVTQQIGDQWVAALKRVEDAVTAGGCSPHPRRDR